MDVIKLGAGVFTINNFLSADECKHYIHLSEKHGYEIATINAIAGPEVNKEIRNNDRVIFDDQSLAERFFLRAKPLLPPTLEGWQVSGFNERFRFYRYAQEHYFKWHKDGCYICNETEESMLTFIIYLNDDFEQGYTEFAWEKIQPKAGMALVFPHRLSHRAIGALCGIKYVLRTDVMYQNKSF